MNTTTSKRLLSLLLALITALSLCVPVFADNEAGGAAGGTTGETTTSVSTIVDATLSSTLAQEKAALTSPDFGSEWVILGLARSGYLEKGSKYFNDYYTRVVSYVNREAKNVQTAGGAPAGALHPAKSTENSRLIITLAALGRDAQSVGDWNLLAPYEDFSWIKKQGLNGATWALIALDTVGYETKDTTIRQQCIDYILGRQLLDGGWDVREESTKADPDMTAMTLQALAKYQDQKVVKAAVDKAVACLSKLQNADGNYSSYEAVNSESTSQVIVACAVLGINPHTDSRFVKSGKSPVDALLTFYNAEKKAFHHTMTVKDESGNVTPTDVDGMATEQAAYQRLMNKKTSLYDMSDVAKDCAAGEHTFGDWKETAATCTEAGTKTHTCTKCGRSEFVETTPALGHKSGSGYEMSDTKHWFPCVLCGAHLKEANHKYTGDQCVVCNYHKVGGRIEITPLTTLPAALKSVSALSSMTKLKSQMVTAVQKVDKNIKAENTQMLDVTLMIPSVVDNKTVWSPAAKDSFPANGKITVLLPYPQGTGKSGYEFVVVHAFTTDDFGKTVGTMESPSVTKTADGIQVTTTGLSPILIGWKAGSDSVIDKLVKASRTGDTSQTGLWACGVMIPAAAIVVLVQKKKRSAR